MIQQALSSGIDMREYNQSINEQLQHETSHALDTYQHQEHNLHDLNNKIDDCDQVLANLEALLSRFRESIDDVSSEIELLRDESLDMNIKLNNYNSVYTELETFSQGIAVDNAFKALMRDTPIDDNYLECLLTLEEKVAFVTKYHSNHNILAIKELRPQLDQLSMMAVQRVSRFLLDKMQKLKRTNGHGMQQIRAELLKHHYFFKYIQNHSPNTATDMRHVYVDIMSKYYSQFFKLYISSLQKHLEKTPLTKNHTLVEKKSKFSSGTKSSRKSFQLGARITLLEESFTSTIPAAHLDRHTKISFESMCRSVNVLLMTLATSEYIFCMDFFGAQPDNAAGDTPQDSTTTPSPLTSSPQIPSTTHQQQQHVCNEMFKSIFSKAEKLVYDSITQYLKSSYDAVAILLLIRLIQQIERRLHATKIQCMDTFYDDLLMNMWLRFREIFDAHSNSVKTVNIDKIFSTEKDSHTITKRYTTFACSIHLLNQDKDSTDRQMLDMSLGQLRNQMVRFLDAVSARFHNNKEGLAFLINSYDTIIKQFIHHNLNVEDGHHFRQLLEKKVNQFIDIQLQECFGRMIQYVNRTEPRIREVASNDRQGMERNLQMIDTDEVDSLVREFNGNWQTGINHIKSEIEKEFSSLETAMEIFKEALTQLLKYYQRFQLIIARCFRNPPFKAMIVSNQKIMHFVKQLS
mmetsp:Transcript_2062/g.7410  ORF Transcript_2062/g.7410 Transcript_2062/m.7410 type:complete len:688 (-) Transcript_2062:145-2208(-)